MIVMPSTWAFTSRRRFTLLKVFSASAIASFETAHDDASAAAAVAFHTLYSPASGNSRSAQGWPSCSHRPSRRVRVKVQVRHFPVRPGSGSVSFYRAKGFRQTTLQAWAFGRLAGGAIEGHDASAARDQIHQALECRLNGIEVFVNVGMIEFDRSENDGVGKVVQEFRTLVEEGGVVLVAFEDEVLALAEMKARSEIFSNAADQERGIAVQRDERSRRASTLSSSCRAFRRRPILLSRARNSSCSNCGSEQNGMRWSRMCSSSALPREMALPTTTKSGFGSRFFASNGWATGMPRSREKIRHRRIGGGVGTGDAVSALLEHSGQRGHGGAADADQVDVFCIDSYYENQSTTKGTKVLEGNHWRHC